MVYCANCGQKLDEGFYFCPKCGTKTKTGRDAGVSEPWEAMREAFQTAGEEMRKAFQKAGEEMRGAFMAARRESQVRRISKSIQCSKCGANNSSEAKFCRECGKPLS